MPIHLNRAALLAYRERRWDVARESKESYWAAETRSQGPIAGLVAGAALWTHARQVDPSWPTAQQRREDLEHHVALAAKLQRVAHVFTGC